MKRWSCLSALVLFVFVLPLSYATYPIAWQSRFTQADDGFDGRIANVEINSAGNITVFSGAGYGIALINPRTGHMTPRRLQLPADLFDGFTDEEGCYVTLRQVESSSENADHDIVFTRFNPNGAELTSCRFQPPQLYTDAFPVDLVELLDGTAAFAFSFTDSATVQPHLVFWDQDSGRFSHTELHVSRLIALRNGDVLVVDDGSHGQDHPRITRLSRAGAVLWTRYMTTGPVPFAAIELADEQLVYATRDPGGIGWIYPDGGLRDWIDLPGTVRAIAQGGPTRENRAVFLLQENGSSTVRIGHALYQQVLWIEDVEGVNTYVRSMVDTPDSGYLLLGYPTRNGDDHSNLIRLGGVVPAMSSGSNIVLDPDGGTLSLPSQLETGVIPDHHAKIERFLIHEAADTLYRSTMQTTWLTSFEHYDLPDVHVQLDADDPDGDYEVVLQVSDMAGTYTQQAVREFSKLASGFRDVNEGLVPDQSGLLSVYPNPFNGTTTITIDLAYPMLATLAVFDLLGREMDRISAKKMLAAGSQRLEWNASTLPAGIYFLHANLGDQQVTRRVVLLK